MVGNLAVPSHQGAIAKRAGVCGAPLVVFASRESQAPRAGRQTRACGPSMGPARVGLLRGAVWSHALGECRRKECFISWSGNHKTSYDRRGRVRSPLDLGQYIKSVLVLRHAVGHHHAALLKNKPRLISLSERKASAQAGHADHEQVFCEIDMACSGTGAGTRPLTDIHSPAELYPVGQ